MFGISWEHILVLGVVLLVLGPRRLPELGNSMGKAIRNFKDGLAGVKEAQHTKIEDPPVAERTIEPEIVPETTKDSSKTSV